MSQSQDAQTTPPSSSKRSTSMRRAMSYLNFQDLSHDPVARSKRTGMLHSAIMGFCLLILLMTILVTQEPYRYIRSNLAIQKGAHVTSLQEDPDLNIDAIWDWIDALSDEIGGETHTEIVQNCGYGSHEVQTVTVDGVAYEMVKPSKQESACTVNNLEFISGEDDPLYLIGSHQILAIGMFTKRANTNFPIEGSVASTETTLEINSDKSEPLNPLKDNKVVEVCTVNIAGLTVGTPGTAPPTPATATAAPTPAAATTAPTPATATTAPTPGAPPGGTPRQRRSLQGPANDDDDDDGGASYFCIHKDGFAVERAPYTPGSTMNWQGEVVEQDGVSYYTFDRAKRASFFSDDARSFTTYPPCYITDEVNGTVLSGIPEFGGPVEELRANLTDCVNTWVSKGRDFRTQCLAQQNTGQEATAQQAYLAGLLNTGTVPLLYEALFGCDSLINWNVQEIDDAFVESKRAIESYLPYDKSYGAFFPTGSEQEWVEDAIVGGMTLKMHGFLDKQTTDMTLYIVTRNLNEDALFYTLVKVSFEFRVNGYSNVKYHPIFSPIIQYDYGTDGYGWRHRRMFVWEVIFLILFSMFALRELHQLIFSRIIPFLKNIFSPSPVLPEKPSTESERPLPTSTESEEKKKNNVHFDNSSVNENNGDVCVDREEDDAPDLELEKSERGIKNDSSAPDKRPNTAGMIDLNNDGKDDIEQLSNFMRDLNGNGIDDAEELRELVDDFLPDEAGMLDILDWLTIGIVSLSIYYRWDFVDRTAKLHEFFIDLAEEGNYHEEMTEIITSFAEIDDNRTVMNVLVMILVFFGLVQFFRYLSFDKRLGIVTATIKESLGSLLPVLLIFLVVMFSYAVLGTVMYGTHLNSWSNIGKSVAQLFLLILGEFGSYFDIMQINPVLSAIFFWSYITMALFLLFNMVLAVIFTVYDEKSTEIQEAEKAAKERAQERTEKKESKKDK